MSFIKEFQERGYLYQCTDLEELSSLSNKKQLQFYIGFDCTANSLHVGNLMQIMILRLLQRYGHKPIVLVGGATTRIGDPSGKDETRKMLSDQQIHENIQGIKKSLSKFINFGSGENDAILLNNDEWLSSLGYIEFLRDYGKEFSVNKMLSMDSVKSRLDREQPLSFLEFNYMLLQAYDFKYLSENYDCHVQLGGREQWGNIVMGTELIRKRLKKAAFGLTTPLLTTSTGAKMGKTAEGAIWLNEDRLSPYDYFQFWRNIDDADVLRFSKLYAEFDHSQQNDFAKLAQSDINTAKKELAYNLTKLCHGKSEANKSLDTARKVFEEGGTSHDLPQVIVDKRDLDKGLFTFELVYRSGTASSKSEAKKLVKGGGVKINDSKITDENIKIDSKYLNNDGYLKLSVGKKKHVLVKY